MSNSVRILLGLLVTASAVIVGWIFVSSGPSTALPLSPPVQRAEVVAGETWVAASAGAASSPVDASPTGPAVVLSGVVVGGGGGDLAIVSVDRRPETMLRVGDELAPSTPVMHIDDGSMTYRFAGRQIRVVVQPAMNALATASAEGPAKPLPGFVLGAPPLARPAGTEPGSGNDAFRQAVAKKVHGIAAGN